MILRGSRIAPQYLCIVPVGLLRWQEFHSCYQFLGCHRVEYLLVLLTNHIDLYVVVHAVVVMNSGMLHPVDVFDLFFETCIFSLQLLDLIGPRLWWTLTLCLMSGSVGSLRKPFGTFVALKFSSTTWTFSIQVNL